MPLITPEDKRLPERFNVALHPDTALDLRLYADYAEGSTHSYIINEALQHVFKTDKGFQEFKKSHTNHAHENGKS